MKVVHVIPRLKLGGVEAAVLSSYDYLISKGINFKILALERGTNKYNNSNIFSLNSSVISILLYLRFFKFVCREKPDLMIFSLWKTSFLGILLVLFRKLIRVQTRTAIIIHSSKHAHIFDKYVTNLAVKLLDNVYFDSQEAKALYNIEGEIISFILRKPECIPTKVYDLNYSFVFIGRVHPVKNILAALNFIRLIKSQNIKVIFDIYGPDEGGLAEVQNYIRNYNLYDVVSIKGPVEGAAIKNILPNYTFYLQFSKYEGMAISVVEAMQYGLIPCVTNVGEINNYCKDDYNAFIFDLSKINSDCYLVDKLFKIRTALENNNEYEYISNNARTTFLHSRTYKEDVMSKVIHNKKN
ncbi:glycosyltransferase family 4 protein [Escherichia coli]|nr:glycosyltransferase family 4 protein [Escherichia coli]QMK59428.1 glycosyltransferase family 4 protein [Escherichia coli]QMN94268.1 glycosyltransferase family 4 protein [Escherichia coli]QMO08400.1 glycosyltransferase family 4 protein [Escherichia coli]